MRVGLDIGSTTIKCVVLDENDQILYSSYDRHYSHIIEKTKALLTKINDLQSSELWIQRFTTNYPDHIEMYRCALHHYFSIKDKIHFFEYMNRLKHSNIPIDNDMLELIRTFS